MRVNQARAVVLGDMNCTRGYFALLGVPSLPLPQRPDGPVIRFKFLRERVSA
jgi:hypothetical protein